MKKVIVIGSGPAGISASLYLKRSGKIDVTVISKGMGALEKAEKIENFYGFETAVTGAELHKRGVEGAKNLGIDFLEEQVVSLNFDENFKPVVETDKNKYISDAVLIATGASRKSPNIKGLKEFEGKGISYCAVCDGALYQDKTVVVVGGGNTAVEEGIYLTRFAKEVYIVHRRDELRADKIIQERAFKNDKIEFVWDSKVNEIQGDDVVNNIVIENIKTKEITNIKADGIFPYIGFTPNVSAISGQLKQNENGFIVTDETMQTSVEGVFAAGDVRTTPLRQVITAASDGAVAGVYAGKFLQKLCSNISENIANIPF